ncbi:MAG: glycosyltransferase [Gallionella sp.]|nr:glycosyltransferase [Gallionella sp.]
MTSQLPIFLSLVITTRNRADELQPLLMEVSRMLGELVSDHEIVIVDNSSDDDSLIRLKALTGSAGLPNMQVYALTKEVDSDTASWVGLENALGDFVAVIDPIMDDISFLPTMLDKAICGADVVFASNEQKAAQSLAYQGAYAIFNKLYKWFNGIHLAKEAPQYRVLSKRVVNFILQHPQPAMTYRHLPATGGFARVNLSYSATPLASKAKRLGDSIDRGMRLLVSTTRAPMRLVTSLSLFGAVANLVYSIYVVAIALLKVDVAPGWVSLSLQQSGMFFLISLVLLVLGEYILNMVSLQNEGPLYHVGQEFTSARMTRREKLNIEVALPQRKESRATEARDA